METLVLLSLVFTGLTLLPLGAHLLEFPNKMTLPKEEFIIAQKLYRGWALSGLVELPAVVLLSIHAFLSGWSFLFVFAASCAIVAHLIFWKFTFPVNKRTNNWKNADENWKQMRTQWEYSHVVRAILFLFSFGIVIYYSI